MATVTPVITRKPLSNGSFDGWQVQWSGMKNGDVGVAVDLIGFHDRSFQVEGTFGAGGNAELQGSNDDDGSVTLGNYRVLRDPSSTALDITAASIHGVLEATNWVRPKITGGDGTTSLTVTMFLRSTR